MLHVNKFGGESVLMRQHPTGIPHREKEKWKQTVGEAVSCMLLGFGGLSDEHVPALEWVEASQNPSWQPWWERKGRLRKATLEGTRSVWEMVTGNSFRPGQKRTKRYWTSVIDMARKHLAESGNGWNLNIGTSVVIVGWDPRVWRNFSFWEWRYKWKIRKEKYLITCVLFFPLNI